MVVPQVTRLRERIRLGVSWDGGWEVMAPLPAARIGDRSLQLRVLGERMEAGRYVVTLQGRARRTYGLRVRGPATVAAIRVEPNETVMPALQLGERDGAGWQALQVTMPATGADDDDYVTLRLVISID
jgi:hypothetical protein